MRIIPKSSSLYSLLAALCRACNVEKYRDKEMQLKDRIPNMSEDEQIELLASDGMLVKRPILVQNEKVLVGFKEKEWQEIL